jgi:hypothetical protein
MSFIVEGMYTDTPAFCAGVKKGDELIAVKLGTPSKTIWLNSWDDWEAVRDGNHPTKTFFMKSQDGMLKIRTLTMDDYHGYGWWVTGKASNDKEAESMIREVEDHTTWAARQKAIRTPRLKKVEMKVENGKELEEAQAEINMAQAFLDDMKVLEAKTMAGGVRVKLQKKLDKQMPNTVEKVAAMMQPSKPTRIFLKLLILASAVAGSGFILLSL